MKFIKFRMVCLFVSVLTLMVCALSIFTFKTDVLADDNREYSAFYDFNDYTAAYGSWQLPGDEWGFRPFGQDYLKGRIGSEYDDKRGNRVLKVGSGAMPTLFFGQLFNTGQVHISYYVRTTAHGGANGPSLYDARNGESGREITNSNYYMRPLVTTANSVSYRKNMSDWNEETQVYENDDKWHRIDIFTSELSSGSPGISMYYDGKEINPEPLTNSLFKGIKAIGFGCAANWQGGESETAVFTWYDDVYVKRYYDKDGFDAEIKGNSQIPKDGEIYVTLHETVNSDMLVKENISIKNITTNQEVTDFIVDEVTNGGFKIKFSGLSSGMYNLILKDNVKSDYFDLSMTKPVYFSTEPEKVSVSASFLEENFDDYTEQNTLPSGWVNIDDAETASYFQPSDGKSGNALGALNVPQSSTDNVVRLARDFSGSVPKGTEFDISFDVYSDASYWYLDVFNSLVSDSKAAKGRILSGQGNKLYYSANGSSMSQISGVNIAEKKWHNIRIKIKPNADNSAKSDYIISIDGGGDITVTASRNFGEKPARSMAIGYLPNGDENTFRIDNIKVSAGIEATVPEIESISLIDVSENKINLITDSDKVTSFIEKAVIGFNTMIDEKNVSNYVSVSGKENDSTYSLSEVDGKSILTIEFSRLLMPNATYTLSIDNVPSVYSNSIVMKNGYSKSFNTTDDGGIRLARDERSEADGKHYVWIAKTDDSIGKYSFIMSGYKNISKTEGKTATIYQYLEKAEYFPIIMDSEYKGIQRYEFNLSDFAGCDSVKSFLWNYPTNKRVNSVNGLIY